MRKLINLLLAIVPAVALCTTVQDGGEQEGAIPAATQAEIDANTSANGGTVTVHSDVSDAGSGVIISAAERVDLTNNTAKVSYTDATKVAGIEDGATSNNAANITGLVTVHSDVTSAGSGSIISSAERTKLTGIADGATSNNSANITGLVTVHSDVSSAGSGSIISSAERTKLTGIADGATSNNSANITGLVTVHSDVSSAGSGSIISSAERTKLTGIAEGATSNNSANITGLVTVHSDVTSAGSGSIITSGERTKLTALDVYAASNNTYSGAAVFDGYLGVTNALRGSDDDVYMLWVPAPTNNSGLDPHAIGLWLGDDTMTNQPIHGLHAYCTKDGTNLHVFKLDRNTGGGGEFQLYDGDEQLVVDINATDEPEILVVGRFTAREGTGSGVSPNAAADSFIVDSSSLNSGITLTSTNGGNANIFFGTANKGNNAASIQYISSIDRMRWKIANATRMELLTTGASLLARPTCTNTANSANEIVNYGAVPSAVENQALGSITLTGSAGTNMILSHLYIAPTNYLAIQMVGSTETNLYPVIH